MGSGSLLRRGVAAATCLAVALVAPGGVGAQPSTSPSRKEAKDDRAPAGRWRAGERSRPKGAVLLGCSPRYPICVHALPNQPDLPAARGGDRGETDWPAWLVRALAAGEAAADAALALDLPLPLPDPSLGGDAGFDVYLAAGEPTARAWPDPPAPLFRLDRSSAFALSPPPAPSGCAFEIGIARALFEASLLGLDASVDAGTLGMHSSYLATVAAPCAPVELEAVDRMQRAPERGLSECDDGPLCGVWPFPWYLDDRYGIAGPGAVMSAAIALGAGASERTAPVLDTEPDPFDVLRFAASDRGTSLDDILLDFAVARAFLGSRSDGAHLSDADRFGSFGRVRFEWAIDSSSLPRRLAPLGPIEPLGMSYVWLGIDGPVDGLELFFQADWQSGLHFRWALVKVDAEGRELGRLRPGGAYGHNQVQQTVSDLRSVEGLLLVGVAMGSDDRSRPFDPEEPMPPLDYSITLRRL